MTLTAILPSLRRSIPDPMTIDLWPEFTTASVSDVTVAGVSLTRLVDWCGTPCVHTAAAVIPGTHGRPSDLALASVIVTAVSSVERRADGGLDVGVDAALDAVDLRSAEARLIGRASSAHATFASLLHLDESAHDHAPVSHAASLPADLRVGDLVAIPSVGVATLHQVRAIRTRATGDGAERPVLDSENRPLGHCGR